METLESYRQKVIDYLERQNLPYTHILVEIVALILLYYYDEATEEDGLTSFFRIYFLSDGAENQEEIYDFYKDTARKISQAIIKEVRHGT